MSSVTPRQARARLRLFNAKKARRERYMNFLMRRARARNIEIEGSQLSCHIYNRQLVREVRRFAGVYLYRSSACSGCTPGQRYLDKHPETENVPQPKDIHGCDTVRARWFISLVPVEVGQVIVAENPYSIPEDSITV